jgi:hypothetical protein
MKRSNARDDSLEDYPTGDRCRLAPSARNSPIATSASRCDFAKTLNENTAEEILRCCNLSYRVNLVALSIRLLVRHGSSEDSQARLRWSDRRRWPRVSLLLDFAHFNNDATHVVTALGAYAMGWDTRAAAAANLQLLGLLVMVGSTLARASIRVSTLGNCHFEISQNNWG